MEQLSRIDIQRYGRIQHLSRSFNIATSKVNTLLPVSSGEDVSCDVQPHKLMEIVRKWSNCKVKISKENLTSNWQMRLKLDNGIVRLSSDFYKFI